MDGLYYFHKDPISGEEARIFIDAVNLHNGRETYVEQGPQKTTLVIGEERFFDVERVVFDALSTTVFWKDGTHTTVKAMAGVPFYPYYGFCAAVVKRIYGSNSHIKKIIHEKSGGQP